MGCIGNWRSRWNVSAVWFGTFLSALIFALHAAPPNDNLTNATVLTGATNLVIASNVGATTEPGEPNHAFEEGGKSVWWSWQSPFTGSVLISTAGSDFDTLLAVYTGTAISNLQLVAENDDDGGFGVTTSSLVFRAYAGETFLIAVDGFDGASGTVHLGLGRAGYPAPAWQLFDLNTNLVTSADFQNRVLVLDFWETTCGACSQEVPSLVQLYQNFLPQGLSFFGASKDPESAKDNVRYFVETYGVPYGVGIAPTSMSDAFGGDNIALPTKFVIDRENMVVGSYTGGADYTYYVNLLRPLLRGTPQVSLRARRSANDLILAWPATEFGYSVETLTSLAGTNWTGVSSSVVTTNDENTVTISAPPGTQFFRLRKTNQ